MKHSIIITLFITLAVNSLSQVTSTNMQIRDRLYKEIISYNQIESKYIGCYGNKSSFYLKLDSFVHLFSPNNFIRYFDDSSHLLKYYSYMTVLYVLKNDTIAFDKLKFIITDSTKIDYEFAGLDRGTMKFNEIIASEYTYYLRSKYYYGGRGTFRDYTVKFLKPNRSLYKRKLNELKTLLVQNKLDTRILEKYCR